VRVAIAGAVLLFFTGCTTLPTTTTLPPPLHQGQSEQPQLVATGTAGVHRADGRGWTLFQIDGTQYDANLWLWPSDRKTTVAEIAAGTEGEILFSTTPWRYVDGEKRPAGIQRTGGETIGFADASERWAVGWENSPDHGATPFVPIGPDERDACRAAGNDENLPENLTGAFYPLVRDGVNVAARYPLPDRRAARVAFGWNPDATILLILAVDGEIPVFRPGITTVAAAELFRMMGAFDAVNLDGGRSGFVFIKSGDEVHPRIPGRRRVGPAGIVLVRVE